MRCVSSSVLSPCPIPPQPLSMAADSRTTYSVGTIAIDHATSIPWSSSRSGSIKRMKRYVQKELPRNSTNMLVTCRRNSILTSRQPILYQRASSCATVTSTSTTSCCRILTIQIVDWQSLTSSTPPGFLSASWYGRSGIRGKCTLWNKLYRRPGWRYPEEILRRFTTYIYRDGGASCVCKGLAGRHGLIALQTGASSSVCR